MDLTKFVGIWLLIWFAAGIVSCAVVHIISTKIERKSAERIAAEKRWRAQNFKNIMNETRDI